MAGDEKWYFTKEKLATTPSRRCGFDADKELSYRQQAANFIQDMGQRLVVSQLCINTAIVYMHRFYVFHSLTQFHRNAIAAAALFLAAKVEEQPRKLEHVIRVAHNCLHKEQQGFDIKSEQYLDQAQDLVFNENVLLQTLGFDVAIDHPHTHVVRCCQLVKASKDLAQTSYFMASNSLHLTTMCLQYKPTVVACFCIHLACKWSDWEIPQSNEGKPWFWYVDRTVTLELLQQLTAEFLHIFDKCPSRWKQKIKSISDGQSPSMSHPAIANSPFDMEPRKIQSPGSGLDGSLIFHSARSQHPLSEKSDDKKTPGPVSGRPPVDYREYREKKERERLDREKAAGSSQGHSADPSKHHHSHHHKPVPRMAVMSGKHSAPPPVAATTQTAPGQKSHAHHNHHHRLDMKPGQLAPPRHSTSAAAVVTGSTSLPTRDSARRQRSMRDYNAASGTGSSIGSGGGTTYPHGHVAAPRPKEPSQPYVPTSDSVNNRSDQNVTAEQTSSRTASQDNNGKLGGSTNNNHNVHRTNPSEMTAASHRATDGKHQPTDKRQYDPMRHKPPEHRKEDQKLYNKYGMDPSRAERQRKPDILEQRSEEVRKLIEKPLQTMKPRQELQKEEYIANMLKQPHHTKYNQEKLQGNPVVILNQMKLFGNAPQVTSPTVLPQHQGATGGPSSVSHSLGKPSSTRSSTPTAQYSVHGVSQILKDTVKNGNSQSSVPASSEDLKTEAQQTNKKQRNEEVDRMQSTSHQTPPIKHRSLFSPEKILQPRDIHPPRVKSQRQRTPPSSTKFPRQEQQRQLDTSTSVNTATTFTSCSPISMQADLAPTKRAAANESSLSTSSSQKRHRISNSSEPEQTSRTRSEDVAQGLDTAKMLGRVPELIQPIRDNPASVNNGKSTTSVANDLRPPELIKPFEPEPVTAPHRSSLQTSSQNLSHRQLMPNGYDVGRSSDGTPQDIAEQIATRYSAERHETAEAVTGTRYTSPTRTSETISALLQETPTPMPSLLQPEQSPTDVQSGSVSGYPSTDDASSLIAQVPQSRGPGVPLQVAEEKRPEPRKSDKKKKKDKHKNRDKEKDREQSKEKRKEEKKHKRKHKDKDKERNKHRERETKAPDDSANLALGTSVVGGTAGTTSMVGTAIPIKITIPKDKINLSSADASVQSAALQSGQSIDRSKSPQGSGLKIKIPKERLKGGDSVANNPTIVEPLVQAPLKIKIRTDAISRSGESSYLGGGTGDVRKRERDADVSSPTTLTTGPPNKKHLVQTTNYAPQRPADRQNGRHYSSSGNNKVRGGGKGRRRYSVREAHPPPLASYNQQIPSLDMSYSAVGLNSQECMANTYSSSMYSLAQFSNYPPPLSLYNHVEDHRHAAAYYEPCLYYQRYQAAPYSLYPTIVGNVMITSEGTIDTSVPPPSYLAKLANDRTCNSRGVNDEESKDPPPPLPAGPPPASPPPPPPPPPTPPLTSRL